MLKDCVKAVRPDDEELSQRLNEERAKLFAAQMKIKDAGLPVMVTFEGWGAAGKGSVLGWKSSPMPALPAGWTTRIMRSRSIRSSAPRGRWSITVTL